MRNTGRINRFARPVNYLACTAMRVPKERPNKKNPAREQVLAGFTVALAVLFALFSAWFGAHALIRAKGNAKALDDTWGGLRKVHLIPTPRIGGIAIALGLVAGL